jgi:hypothetical protein
MYPAKAGTVRLRYLATFGFAPEFGFSSSKSIKRFQAGGIKKRKH